MMRRVVSIACTVIAALITAFIWMLAGMFLVSRMYGPAVAYAALAAASAAFQVRVWKRRLAGGSIVVPAHQLIAYQGDFRHPVFRKGVVRVPSYPLVGHEPSWLRTPYHREGGCYGCGLEAEVMNPGRWALCFWCNELRLTLKSRERVPLWAV